MLAACSSTPEFPVDEEFLGGRISTTVDSEVARYFLEDYLQDHKSNPLLDERIDNLYARQTEDMPTRDELKKISEEYSLDFAALFFADRLWKIEKNRNIQTDFYYFLDNEDLTLSFLNSLDDPYLVLFVPGWDYVENGHLTGADFAEPRRLVTKLGIENYLVDIAPHGSVEENSDHLTNYLARYRNSTKSIIIVGPSSAGPAIHLSLAEKLKDNQQTNIKAWVNLGGILRGSPLLDSYQEWPRSWLFNIAIWYRGWEKEKVLSMSAKNSRKRFRRLGDISSDILVINYLGLSLSGRLSKYSKDSYPLLAPEGPNDGLTLLSDIIAPNSLTIVALGSDHFFAEDPRINDKTVALTKVVISYLENDVVVTSGGDERIIYRSSNRSTAGVAGD
jgi:hypothetical protein